MIGQAKFYSEDAPAQLALLAEGLEQVPLTDAMKECADVGRQSMRDNFNSSATPDGDDWLQRKIVGDGHPLLMDKGPLIQAATGGGPGHIEIIEPREVALGVDGRVISYAATHNFGRDWGRGSPIPKREFAGLKPAHEDACENIIADAVMAEVFG